MQVHDYLRLIMIIIIIIIIIMVTIIIIMVTIKITQINFQLTSRLLLPYVSVINVNAELKAEGEVHRRVRLTLYRPLSFISDEVVTVHF